jgi:hypothetical protein
MYKKIRLLLLRSTAAGRARILFGFLLEGVAWGSISGEIVRVVRA